MNKSDIKVKTEEGLDDYQNVEWVIDSGILCVEDGGGWFCYPLTRVIHYWHNQGVTNENL